MNVNRLYVAFIYINCFERYLLWNELNLKGKFLKNTIVYHDERNNYIDLISGENINLV